MFKAIQMLFHAGCMQLDSVCLCGYLLLLS